MAIKLEHQTVAQCSPEQVWSVFSRVDQWPQWSRMFTAAGWVGEPWQPGSEIFMELSQPALKVKGKVEECTLGQSFTIKGGAMGVEVKHWFEFSPQGTATLMRSGIELSGPATFCLSKAMQRKGLDSFAQWFESLREHAERTAALT